LTARVGVIPHVREAFEVLFPALHRRAQARGVEDITADLVYGIEQIGTGRIAHYGRDVVSPLDGLGDDSARTRADWRSMTQPAAAVAVVAAAPSRLTGIPATRPTG
jgi:hypothetical protein